MQSSSSLKFFEGHKVRPSMSSCQRSKTSSPLENYMQKLSSNIILCWVDGKALIKTVLFIYFFDWKILLTFGKLKRFSLVRLSCWWTLKKEFDSSSLSLEHHECPWMVLLSFMVRVWCLCGVFYFCSSVSIYSAKTRCNKVTKILF